MVKHLAIDKEALQHLRTHSHFTFLRFIYRSFEFVHPRKIFQSDHFIFHNEIQITHLDLS